MFSKLLQVEPIGLTGLYFTFGREILSACKKNFSFSRQLMTFIYVYVLGRMKFCYFHNNIDNEIVFASRRLWLS